MGNNVGCSRFCETTPIIQQNLEEIVVTGYHVPCQICNSHFKLSPSQEHIDLFHYGAFNQKNEGKMTVQCLLCSKTSTDLIEHSLHITAKHPYATKIQKKSKFQYQLGPSAAKQMKLIQQWQLNKIKKTTAIKLQNENDFEIMQQIQTNHYEAMIKGRKYDVFKYSKQFKRNEHKKQLVQAELIWFHIFKRKNKCKYYYLDLEQGQRYMLCKGYIFIEKNQ